MPVLFKNKVFIFFLIFLTAILPLQVAQAKGVLSVVAVIISVVVAVIAVIVLPAVAPGFVQFVNTLVGFTAIGGAGAAGLVGVSAGLASIAINTVLEVTLSEALCLVGVNSLTWSGCRGSSDQGGSQGGTAGQGSPGSPTLNNQTATPIKQNDCVTGFTLSYNTTDAYQYGIYRDNNLINQGILSQTIQPSPFIFQFSYNDTGLAPNTNYAYDLVLTNQQSQQFRSPTMNVYTDCAPTLSFQVSPEVEIPDPIYLSWTSQNTNACSASSDWSGDKLVAGSEYLTKARGTYTFTLSCSGPNGSVSDTKTSQVIQVPRCDFTNNPVSIIPPQFSTLSWNCSYADTCSINQGIGSVDSISGSKQIRPTQATTYTLTCSGLDGSRDYSTTVNVSFTPIIKEVIPR